jgi:hypothetical protein
MAIQIIQSPPDLLLSKQPVVFVLASNAAETPLRLGGGVTDLAGDSVATLPGRQESFDFAGYLQGLVKERGKQSDTPEAYQDVPKAVTFTFSEYYGTPPSYHYMDETSAFLVLDGKVPDSRKKLLYASYSNLLSYLQDTKSCLTWFPAGEPKKVLPGQKEFLNYLQVKSNDPVDLILKISLLFTDNSAVNMNSPFSTVPAVNKFGLVYFPTGYDQLGIESFVAINFPGKEVKRYTVAVFSGGIAFSRAYSYLVDCNYYEHPRQLWIRNPFGLWEALLCTGEGETNHELTQETVATDEISLPGTIAWRSEKTDSVKVNTGFLTAGQMTWLADLLDTLEAYELIENVLHPIVFKTVRMQSRHDGTYQYSADIEYEYSFNEVVEKQ